jgi:hypothetical protein
MTIVEVDNSKGKEVTCDECGTHLGWEVPDTGFNDAGIVCDGCWEIKKMGLDKLAGGSS